ncbi:hypothetical protein [Acetobacter syzygii]|uniref:hypothetical protein n=1 Tax=Acetobacter syzygii TaxID=146476 RepID=UPI0011BD4BCB|nr:hypothetical protein [Acetobacter syzygii]NSL93514.1 hypothetical protein [Acetobacter syzygii]
MQRHFPLRGFILTCLLMLGSMAGVWVLHSPAHATQTTMVHAPLHNGHHHAMAPGGPHNNPTSAVGCPSATAAVHHLMHHHAACCMTGNALSVMDPSADILPAGFLWHAAVRPVFTPQHALPDRRAAPLLRPPRLHTA